jgi:hypothetical protein
MDRPSWGSIMRRHRGATDLRRGHPRRTCETSRGSTEKTEEETKKIQGFREMSSKNTNEEKTLSGRQL